MDSPDYLKIMGANIKRLRCEKGFSLRQMAAGCNVDHSDIAKIEKGWVNITILTLLELAKGLDVHPRLIIDFEYY